MRKTICSGIMTFGILVSLSRLCGLGQGIHRVPDDAVRLVDVGDMEHRAVGEGQRASVGGLTACFLLILSQ